MKKINFFTLLGLAMSFLSACAAPVTSSPLPATSTRTLSSTRSSTPTPTLTSTPTLSPTSTPKPTPTPDPVITQLEGQIAAAAEQIASMDDGQILQQAPQLNPTDYQFKNEFPLFADVVIRGGEGANYVVYRPNLEIVGAAQPLAAPDEAIAARFRRSEAA